MAAALGDVNLVRRHLDADPACIRMSVSEEWFPKTLVLAGIIFGIFTFGSRKPVFAIGVVAFGEVLWAAGWIMRVFTHPDQ
jgi:hypothetical protein